MHGSKNWMSSNKTEWANKRSSSLLCQILMHILWKFHAHVWNQRHIFDFVQFVIVKLSADTRLWMLGIQICLTKATFPLQMHQYECILMNLEVKFTKLTEALLHRTSHRKKKKNLWQYGQGKPIITFLQHFKFSLDNVIAIWTVCSIIIASSLDFVCAN